MKFDSLKFETLYFQFSVFSFLSPPLVPLTLDGVRHKLQTCDKGLRGDEAYYPKRELREFLAMILSRDITFSEYARNNRNKYRTVVALAKSMNLTQKQFARHFKRVFGRTPYGWMNEGRSLTIHHEITATKKPFKHIAFDNGFNSAAQFTKFCKKTLGKTPLELRDVKF